jgi:hypothetical protein
VALPVGSSDKFPGPPKLHTIHLFRGDDRTAQNADVYARVSYGVGGSNNSFLVDWSAGCQFSVIANSVRVEAITYAPSGVVPYNGTNGVTAAPLLLGVAFGSGAVGHGPPLTLTEQHLQVDFAAGVNPVTRSFNVPDFARAFIVRAENIGIAGNPPEKSNSDPSMATYLNFFCAGAATSLAYGDCQIFGGPAGALGLPLPGGTQRVQIANGTAGGSAPAPYANTDYRFTLQWVLSL